MINKSIYNHPIEISMQKENQEGVGFVKVIGKGA
jgi:hypothetical protein